MKRVFNDILDFLSTFKGKVVLAIVVLAIGCSAAISTNRAAINDSQDAIAKAEDAATKAKRAANRSHKAFLAFARESRQRRDATCRGDERENAANVKRLVDSYKYLDDKIEAGAVDDELPQLVILNMPSVEDSARHDVAPPYCDEPNIGLPEPDPVIPDQRDYSRFLIKK